jgi:hypothetical protein
VEGKKTMRSGTKEEPNYILLGSNSRNDWDYGMRQTMIQWVCGKTLELFKMAWERFSFERKRKLPQWLRRIWHSVARYPDLKDERAHSKESNGIQQYKNEANLSFPIEVTISNITRSNFSGCEEGASLNMNQQIWAESRTNARSSRWKNHSSPVSTEAKESDRNPFCASTD